MTTVLAREEIERFMHLFPAEWDVFLCGVRGERDDKLTHHEVWIEGLEERPICVELTRISTGHVSAYIVGQVHITLRGLAEVIENVVAYLKLDLSQYLTSAAD
jgi:hypothetical protein